MSNGAEPLPSIAVVGIGGYDADQLTLQADRQLRSAGKIYGLGLSPAALRGLESSYGTVHDLETAVPVPAPGFFPAAAARLCAEARRAGGACLAVPGDAAFYNAMIPCLDARAAAGAIELRLIPGVSSLANLCAELRFDIGRDGAQLLDARRLLDLPGGVSRFFPVVLLGAGYMSYGEFERLRRRLLATHPPGCPVTHALHSAGRETRSRSLSLPLARLLELHPQLNYGSTLIVAGERGA